MNQTQTPSKIIHTIKTAKSFCTSLSPKKTNPLKVFLSDWQSIREKDPAARNWLEILFCYPGLQALCCHRLAHWLYNLGIPLLPRLLSHLSRLFTGIEIHPGAKIGKGVFIDHGFGVVIGETAIVGDHVLIYQGVTLGGTGKETGKRHPTLGNHVLVGAGAKVLGNIQIGDHVRIGAGSVVLRDVPGHCTVVGVPGRITRNSLEREDFLGNESLPDPEATVIRSLFKRIKSLEQQVEELQTQSSLDPVPLKLEPDTKETKDSDQIIEEFLHGAGI